MFETSNPQGYIQVLEGIERKTLVYGENTLMTEFVMKQGSVLPHHNHPYEQTGYVISGHIRLTIGDRICDATPGSSWCITPNIDHGAEILEDTVALEVFSPVRPDYIPTV